MNIVVRTYSGRYIVRPDTTWERDNEDLYLPDQVKSLSFTPVLFARVSKPGRSVSEKFAERYYDGIGFGVLLYPENFIDGSEEGFACASCLDHSSFLPFPVSDKETLGAEDVFSLSADGVKLFEGDGCDRQTICRAIAEATRFIYIRTGDVIAIELASRTELQTQGKNALEICGSHNGQQKIVFKIFL